MKKLGIFFAAVACLMFLNASAQAQLSVTNNIAQVIDFSTTISGVSNGAYTAAGFQPTPTAGQLDSDAWAVTGWSDGALAFGGTRTTAATDYTRGATAAAITPGGFYAYTGAPGSVANPSFLLQPGGSDFAPGTLTLRIVNGGASNITQFGISYNLFVRNDQGRSNSFNFSYSTDDVTYTPVAALDYTSIVTADALGYVQVGTSPSRSTTITGLSIAPGSFFYIRWSSADVGGAGSRDEFALDDISVTPSFVPTAASVSVSGRVTDAYGRGIGRATITMLDVNTSETRTAQTGGNGYYVFEEVPVGGFYVITAAARRYTFAQGTQSFTLIDAMQGVNFTATR